MKEFFYDCAVIGGGASGLASSIELKKNNINVVILEREEFLGGILLQCIHNGFGLHIFKEELTGPEYAERFVNQIISYNIPYFTETTVLNINNNNDIKELYCYSKRYGVFIIKSKTIILAMGCRERNRGNISLPGTRPAGILTAGLAQRLVNIDGYIPGKNIVIVGSGDIGLIMARRMKLIGCSVLAVIEIQKYPSGLTRNIVQCLNDFNIPLYLSHTITKIHGKDRIEKISVTPIIDGKFNYEKTFYINCDTLLLSVGLIPENELSKNIGININPQTNGAIVDAYMMTSIEGIFACGNVLHVHDLVDYVTEESIRTAKYCIDYLNNNIIKKQFNVKAGKNIRYVVPNKFVLERDNKFYLRSMIVKNDAELEVKINNKIIKSIKKPHIQPSEMITIDIEKEQLKEFIDSNELFMEISLN